jgi:PAS domain S-box-containing protein
MLGISLALVAVMLLALAVFVWRADPSNRINRRFAAFAFFGASWTLGIAGAHTMHDPELWLKSTFVSSSLIPPTCLAFIAAYLRIEHRLVILATRAVWSLGIAFACMSLVGPLIIHSVVFTNGVLFRKQGPLLLPFAAYFLASWCLVLSLLACSWSRAHGQRRSQLQYLGAGILIPTVGGITTNLIIPLITARSSYSWLGPYFTLVLIALVAHAIIRHRLMDLRLVIRRGLTLAIAAAVSLLPVAVLLAFVWPRLLHHLEPREILTLLAAVAVVALLVPLTRDVIGRVLDRYVYRRRANYQRTVLEASRVLTGVLDLKTLLPFLRDTVATSTECEGAAIYARAEDGLRLAIGEHRPLGARFKAPARFPDPILKVLQARRDALVTDELLRERDADARREAIDELTRLDWTLVLPLVSENAVIGALVLGPKLSGDPFYPHDLDLLMTLANQAGIAIENAQLYAEVVLAKEYVQNIVSTINSGVVAIDAAERITMLNPTAEQLTGLSGETTRGKSASLLPACLGGALVQTVSDGRARTQPEVDLTDGTTTRPVICTTSPLHDPAGAVVGAVTVFSDLTPVRELEIQRRRGERLAYFEALAAAIAHEVKNPLVAIKTFAQLLPRRRTDERFIQDFSGVVAREIGRMERLVDRLRTLGRPAQRPLGRLDLRQPLAEAMEFLQVSFEEKGVSMERDVATTEVCVLGVDVELEQLFLNLLINALEATPPDGRVSVRLSRTDDVATVDVADTGPGIPPEILDRVFDPFLTTKQRSSGLGLAICAGIAHAHGAEISAANEADGGARFTLELPLAAPVVAPVTR